MQNLAHFPETRTGSLNYNRVTVLLWASNVCLTEVELLPQERLRDILLRTNTTKICNLTLSQKVDFVMGLLCPVTAVEFCKSFFLCTRRNTFYLLKCLNRLNTWWNYLDEYPLTGKSTKQLWFKQGHEMSQHKRLIQLPGVQPLRPAFWETPVRQSPSTIILSFI